MAATRRGIHCGPGVWYEVELEVEAMGIAFDPSLLRTVTRLLARLEDMPFHEIDGMETVLFDRDIIRRLRSGGVEYPRLLIEIRGSSHSRKIFVKKIQLEELPDIELV